MRSLFIASGFAALGAADVAWIDLRLAPSIVGRESAPVVAIAAASPPRAADTTSVATPIATATAEATALAVAMTPASATARLVAPAAPAPAAPAAHAPAPSAPTGLVLHFDVDARAPIDADARDEETMLALLSSDPSLMVIIDGHSDHTGVSTYNDRLSRARAEAIGAMLVARGIARSRIQVIAHGARKPIAAGDDAASLARNRRVEVSFARRAP